MNRDIVIVTGQSGIKVERCLKKVSRDSIRSVTLIDPIMASIAKEEFIRVLSEPPRVQEYLWREAFDKFMAGLSDSEDGVLHLLSFHACYYHQLKTEFDCPVALDQLLRLKDRVKMVIALIDDCYDIYLRLMDDHQMYAHVRENAKTNLMYKHVPAKEKAGPEDAVFQSILNLLRIITWREVEIAFSRKIAGLLEVPFYVIAVKHPRSLFSNLIELPAQELKMLYVSHHISEIRTGPASQRYSSFPSELCSFLSTVSRHDKTILFVPDTIDELRIDRDDQGAFLPRLQQGWPLPYERDWLFEPLPERVHRINPLNPRDFDYASGPKALKSAISSLLSALHSTIKEQVNSRDRTLVEQSRDGIVVYRPYWIPHMSPGVEEELNYNLNLKEHFGEGYRRVYVLNTHEDVGRMLISKLFTVLSTSCGGEAKSEAKSSLDQVRKDMLAERESVLSFASGQYDRKEVIERIEAHLGDLKWGLISSRQTGGKGALTGAERYGARKELDGVWEDAFGGISADPLLEYCDERSSFICGESEFTHRLGEFLPEMYNVSRVD